MTPGLRIEALGDDDWVVFNPQSGQTQLLNETSVAVLSALEQAGGKADTDHITARLADDAGLQVEEAARILQDCWALLLDAGLVTAPQC